MKFIFQGADLQLLLGCLNDPYFFDVGDSVARGKRAEPLHGVSCLALAHKVNKVALGEHEKCIDIQLLSLVSMLQLQCKDASDSGCVSCRDN